MSYPGEREYQLEYPTDDQPPFRLADMAGQRQQRRPRWLVPALCLLAVAVLAGAGGAWAYSVRATTEAVAPVTSPSPSASPLPVASPEVVQLSERVACAVLVPVLGELIDHIEAVVLKGQPPDKTAIAALEKDLRELQPQAPEDMRIDITEMVQAASILAAGGYYSDHTKEPATRLLERCRKYARP